MQKNLTRLFTAVLMAALLVSASIMSVSAADDHGGHADSTVWTPIGGESEQTADIKAGGSYYLTENLSAAASSDTCLRIEAGAGTKVTVCMAGYSINPGDGVTTGLQVVSGDVTLCNCSAEGGHIGVGTTHALKVGNNSGTADSKLTICGNVDMDGNGTKASPTSSVIIYIYKDGSLTLDDGSSVSGNYTSSANGVVRINVSGALVMKAGAEINNNHVTSETARGTVNLLGAGSFAMEGGEISGNTGSYGGVYVYTGEFTMTGGSIFNNTAKSDYGGGGVYVGSAGTFNMTAGEIYGNTASKGSGIAALGNIDLSGSASITNDISLGGAAGKDCAISENVSVKGTLSIEEGAEATFSISGGKFSEQPAEAFVASGYVAQEIEGATDGLLYEVVKEPVVMEEVDACSACVSGLGITAESLAELKLLEDGNTYVLTDDLQATNPLEVEGTVTLCLNNHTLTAPTGATGAFITVQEGASLTICGGENGTGAITAAAGTTNLRGIEVQGTLTLNSGTISGFVSTSYGGGVYVNGGEFTMSDGTIKKNTGTYGAGVHVKTGNFTMNGGTISENIMTGDSNGGAGVCFFGTTFTMTGDSAISSNEVQGENTYGGGGVYLGGSATFNMTNGKIDDNTVSNSIGSGIAGRGNINLSGSASITGDISLNGAEGKRCSISENVSVVGTLSIYSVNAATFSISGGTFSGNTQDELIPWLAKDRAYVVDEVDGAWVVTEGFREANTIEYVRYASALHLALQIRGDNDYLAGQDGAYTVSVTKGGAKYTNTAFETITVAENAEAGYFVIKGIAAKNMGDEFTVTISDNGKELATYTGSIRTAAETMYDAGTAQTALADMINYGIAAQAYFGEGTPMTQLDDGSELSVSNWAETNGAGVSNSEVAVAATLSLKDRIELNIYVDEADVTVTSATTDYTVENNGNVTRVTFHNIDVANVKDTIVVGLSNGATVTYSIADYVLASMNDAEQGALIQALMKYVDSVYGLSSQ